MSITINSNMAASYSALNMKRANNLLTKSLQRLSSGKRITAPSDDAGGLAVGMKLQSALKRAAASRLNTQNGTSFLQMQDGVLKVATLVSSTTFKLVLPILVSSTTFKLVMHTSNTRFPTWLIFFNIFGFLTTK